MANAVVTPELCAREREALRTEAPRMREAHWCAWVFGFCLWAVVFELVRAALRFPHWAWMVR